MTYKEIVDRIKEVVDAHKMLADFGYGNLSDIKAGNDQSEANYPYAFVNPTNHTRTGQSIIYRFNLIVMDMAKDDEFLKIQSECQQYIDDILAHLRFYYNDQVDLTLNVTLTPFKERFQDVVAGMTASLEIELPSRLSDCYAPFIIPPVPPVEGILIFDGYTLSDQLFRPEVGQSPVGIQDIVLDTYNGWRPVNQGGNFYTNKLGYLAEFSFVLKGTGRRWTADAQFPTAPDVIVSGVALPYPATNVVSWPTDPAVGQDFSFEVRWENIPVPANTYAAIQFPNEPAIEDGVYLLTGTQLEIYLPQE